MYDPSIHNQAAPKVRTHSASERAMIDLRVVPLVSCADAIADLPRPILHFKGFASRLCTAEADFHGLDALCAETEGMADAALATMQEAATLVWDGDAHDPCSFTFLIPRLMNASPRVKLVAFLHEENVEDFSWNWRQALATCGDESSPSLLIVSVPADGGSADRKFSGDRFVDLGLIALKATGAIRVLCFGGGATLLTEWKLSQSTVPQPMVKFIVAPVRRRKSNTSSLQELEATHLLDANHDTRPVSILQPTCNIDADFVGYLFKKGSASSLPALVAEGCYNMKHLQLLSGMGSLVARSLSARLEGGTSSTSDDMREMESFLHRHGLSSLHEALIRSGHSSLHVLEAVLTAVQDRPRHKALHTELGLTRGQLNILRECLIEHAGRQDAAASNSPTKARSSTTSSDPLVVYTGITIERLLSISDVTQHFDAILFLNFQWELREEDDESFEPYLEWRNALRVDYDGDWKRKRICVDGELPHVSANRRLSASFSCRLDLMNFPFDSERLEICLVSDEIGKLIFRELKLAPWAKSAGVSSFKMCKSAHLRTGCIPRLS